MRIAYLIPEFPAQTHNFFWNERVALQGIGVDTLLISTRRPNKALVSHAWAPIAEADTVYLAEPSSPEALVNLVEFIRFGPRAWSRALKAAIEGCPPKLLLYNLALMFFATRLVLLMRRSGLSHCHSHSCGHAGLIAMLANRLAGISYSLTLHGDLKDYGPQQPVKFRYAAFAITITQKLSSQIRETLKDDTPRHIGLAPMGVNTAVFQRTGRYLAWAGSGPLRLFSCGRLNYVKGHQDLIRAVQILRDQGIDAVLEIAGEDDVGGSGYRKQLELLVTELDLSSSVSLLGAVSEKRVLQGLCEAHIFVLASHHEPLGVAIMEALSCATPVVATNRGGVPELIDHGVDGYLVSPEDPKILADAIRRVACDETMANAFSAAGRAKVEKSFRSDISARELKRLMETCVRKPV